MFGMIFGFTAGIVTGLCGMQVMKGNIPAIVIIVLAVACGTLLDILLQKK